jgi:TPP-dependent pyruvate/acetoin dehydrogenase alpha subunit
MVRYNNSKIDIFKKASICRNFETIVFNNIKNKTITVPVYLSAGQEYCSAPISYVCEQNNIKPMIFGQHRAHSTYINFGGPIEELIDELLGRKTGCAKGMGGSASIHSKHIDMFGHDGLMGSQVPIAVGACYSTNKPTIAIMGDASAEEDYVLGALGWASTKKLPIVFLVEDNNLSILTEKKVRRNWEMDDVAKAFKMKAWNISDDPSELLKISDSLFKEPILLNINTNRLFWHSGAGQDGQPYDRYENEKKSLGDIGDQIHNNTLLYLEEMWKKQLDKQ